MSGKVAAAAIAAALLLSRCSSTVAALPQVQARSATEAWSELRAIDAAAEVVESYSKLSFDSPRRQTVSARTAVDRQGRFSAELLTPLGTSAATLFSDSSEVVFVNHLDQTYWRGTHAQLSAVSPGVAALFRAGVASGRLLYGLPLALTPVADCEAADDTHACFDAGDFRHTVTTTGLLRAEGPSISFTYAEPAVPPQRVSIRSAGQTIEVQHLDVQSRRGPLRKLSPPSRYRCCVAPTLERTQEQE